ncbi:MAG: hypothetical protein ACLQBK_04215 [Candidatus Sulfotelmatobacter sp.]
MRVPSSLTIPLAFFAALFPAAAPQTPPAEAPRPPQLKLEVIPLKKTYTVGETVSLKYRLTSLVDGTMCFPEPAIEVSGSFEGYLTSDARRLSGIGDRDFFIDDVWPRHPGEEEIRSAVVDRWIKMGMSEPYSPRKLDKTIALKGTGEWELQATYHPPDLKAHDKEIVRSLGCTAPDMQVRSEPAIITVVDLTN